VRRLGSNGDLAEVAGEPAADIMAKYSWPFSSTWIGTSRIHRTPATPQPTTSRGARYSSPGTGKWCDRSLSQTDFSAPFAWFVSAVKSQEMAAFGLTRLAQILPSPDCAAVCMEVAP